ncbi:glutaminase [Rhodococcus sp. 06-156-3C]|uniref:glutaminase n=1 Tax=Nocardiaceae TaxID=85025 RepID=UPI0005230794|nr:MULTISPECIES: glutaminase [Rhodococcus]OZD12165.1 glutaminase [Rhodococcus sp. 06-156-3C]OZD19166.1 glutaminase [Rhodococcus sp. 06-156-4C]OZD20791.1 glutaminase [Rhodococcus sp. 06-156-4a]OZD28967.1 glutaminase [Rhodococcus sp. 06-156-3b]OZD33523.1 glutaminase [Rhodococcus sp. 06-156-3]
MKSPVPDYLREVLDSLSSNTDGEVADYIPDLAHANPDVFGIAVTTVDGRTHSVGDDETEFSIQSISKPFAYAAALTDRGFDAVLDTVGVEPSGEAFNELSLEGDTRRPKNPMINAGAIATHSLLGSSVEERTSRALSFFSTLAGRQLSVDESVCRSELDTADRNLAIAHMLRNYGILPDEAHAVVEGYTTQCSINVTVRDLSLMGATLASGGVHPTSGEQVVSRAVARQTLSVMAGAGMYDAAGHWLTSVGIPAKSGVAGGLLGSLPGQVGIGVLSPRLDSHGNSVRGVQVFERLSDDMGMHLMDVEPYGSSVLRSIRDEDGESTVELQGVVQFGGAEMLLDALSRDTSSGTIVFDVSRVNRFSDVGRRMTLEGMRRIVLDGRDVALIDPDGVLPDPNLGDGTYPRIRTQDA